eukprot:TRINITY_DN2451_c0_g1_i1.p1 TRINITY_DN2451_c0_g1~~TRINITY_DN2451_c0_g1_i1.p1  ORF type:complete len:157 (-),score=28.55 TRINITY_DN2451_c0_g1_i1:552-1022(-)
MMLTYPQDLQNDAHDRVEPVSAEDLNAVRPAIADGKMVVVTPWVVAADFHAAMPTSPGAPVLHNSRVLAGMHLKTIWVHTTTNMPVVEDSEEEAPKQRMDTNANCMWPRVQSSKHDTLTSSSGRAQQQRSVSASAHRPPKRPALSITFSRCSCTET